MHVSTTQGFCEDGLRDHMESTVNSAKSTVGDQQTGVCITVNSSSTIKRDKRDGERVK